MKRYSRSLRATMGDIYGLKDEKAKGRLIILADTLLITVFNVFITGTFYTGFLTMYGMSITDTGILSLIPLIANLLSIFSAKILGHFKRRKGLLLWAKVIYYALYIVVITIMPQFVTDPGARMNCFIVILFVSHGFYALFSPGITSWFYSFYPEDNERRTRFMVYNQIFASVLSSIILIFSSVLTDALSNSPYQNQLILGFRYFAFVLVLIDVGIQTRAEECPGLKTAHTKLKDIVTLPFRHKKFLYCMLVMFVWNFNAYLSGNLWSYHLLNHMHFSYTLINAMAVLYTVILLLLSTTWQRILRRYSWIKTFGIAVLIWVPTELLFFCMTPERSFMYVPLCIIQHILSVGINISYANILYMNLPAEDSTIYISFNAIGCNIFACLGMIVGTYISSITNDDTICVFGMDVYSVQFTTICRAVIMFTMGIILILKWRSFTPDLDIAELEHMQRIRKKYR